MEKPVVIKLIETIKEANDNIFVGINNIGDVIKKAKENEADESDFEWAQKMIKRIMDTQAELSLCYDNINEQVECMNKIIELQDQSINIYRGT